MKKNIIFLIAIIPILFIFSIRECQNSLQINKLQESILRKERAYEITLTDLILDYDNLYKNYQRFLDKYQKQAILLIEKETLNAQLENWQEFEITAYTSNECGTVTAIGIDLEARYAKYLNICAVDPKIIPLGSTVLIKFKDGLIKSFIAADTGSAIKGNRIDIYFTDVKQALEFGRQLLEAQIIK